MNNNELAFIFLCSDMFHTLVINVFEYRFLLNDFGVDFAIQRHTRITCLYHQN